MAPTTPDAKRLRSLGTEMRDFLLRTKRSLDEEIRAYPTPIPRCDAQFNHTYEQRSRLSELLNRVDVALDPAVGPSGLLDVMAAFEALPSVGETAEERSLRARIAEERV